MITHLPLCHHQKLEAQGATIVLRSWTQDSEAALKQGSVDLGINYYPLELSKEIVQTHIANPKLMLCCHQSNPLVSKTQVGLDEIAAYPIVLTQMPDFNRQQIRMLKAIRDKNHLLKVAVRTDKLDVCLDTIRQIPAVLPLNQLAKNALTDDLRLIDLSHIEEIEHTPIGLYNAYKTHETPYQLWLSKVVQDCVESLL